MAKLVMLKKKYKKSIARFEVIVKQSGDYVEYLDKFKKAKDNRFVGVDKKELQDAFDSLYQPPEYTINRNPKGLSSSVDISK